VIVLASYKNIEKAITGVKHLRGEFTDKIKLYFAVNNYYAAVIGIFQEKSDANSKLEEIKSIVTDAYIFQSWAFPYEIKLELP